MTMANVCGSDLHYWRGDIDVVKMGRPTPMALGHEGTGTIHKLGDGVTTDTLGEPLSEGDRVVFQYFYPCMQCPTCLKGHTYACPTRQFDRTQSADVWPHFRGTFAEYYYLHPKHADVQGAGLAVGPGDCRDQLRAGASGFRAGPRRA